jgi:hypothetical protein
MKSGTNQFHGDLFEFLRNTHLNARPFFASGITPYHQNQFGGTFGGPVVKNRLFFFGTYQGLRIRQQILNVSYPLSADERKGLVPSSTPVINPATNAPFPQNAAGEYILPSVNPVAANILKYVPTVAVAGTPYFQAGSSAVNVNQTAFKIDHVMRPSDQVYGSFLLDDTSPHNPFYQGDYPDYGTVHQVEKTHVIAISEVHSFRPSLINEFRFGESYQNELYTNVNPVSPASLGMTGWNYDYLPDAQPEGATFSLLGRFGLGSLGLGKWREGGRNLQFTDTLSWVKGKHNMRMGTDLYHREHASGMPVRRIRLPTPLCMWSALPARVFVPARTTRPSPVRSTGPTRELVASRRCAGWGGGIRDQNTAIDGFSTQRAFQERTIQMDAIHNEPGHQSVFCQLLPDVIGVTAQQLMRTVA